MSKYAYILAIPIVFSNLFGTVSFAESTGSLDSMWIDDSSKSSLTTEKTSASISYAPMCSLASIKASQLIMKGGWPSTGPFKISSEKPFVLIDDNNNELTLELWQDQVTKAQLKLANRQLTDKTKLSLLDIEMNVDFLLESLGLKPNKIANFNQQFQKKKDNLLLADAAPLRLTAGRYAIDIAKENPNSSTYDLLISVSSLDANKLVIQQHSDKPATTDTQTSEENKSKKIETTTEKLPSTAAKKTPVVGNKEQFANLIKNWQQIKKVAVRKRQTTELSQVLSGKALARQNDAIKWLVTNHKYYEMVPKSIIVDKYAEVTPDKKYLVYARVKEYSKYIDDTSGQVLKESETQYSVIYTIEKSNNSLSITDSQLLTPETTNKPSH
jgi:hypothetical protein